MRGKDIGKEELRIEATSERLRNELVVKLEKIGMKLAASAGEGVQVVKIKVCRNRDSNSGESQHRCSDR